MNSNLSEAPFIVHDFYLECDLNICLRVEGFAHCFGKNCHKLIKVDKGHILYSGDYHIEEIRYVCDRCVGDANIKFSRNENGQSFSYIEKTKTMYINI